MSRSPFSSRRRVFLTQDDSSFYESAKSKFGSLTPNPTQELSSLKKKYDTVKQENIKKAQYLEWLQGKVYDLKAAASFIQTDMRSFKDRSEEFKIEIEKAKHSLNQELELKKIYEHTLSRNKTEVTHLDIKVNKFSENVKSAKMEMETEIERARKTKDKKFNIKTALKELKEKLEEDTQKQISHVSKLESSIMKRRNMIRRYDERTKRQADIIELAARKDRKTHEKSIREEIVMSKMLYDLLVEKEKAQQMAGAVIVDAFQEIKTKTGFKDPQEILNKFMSREETHNKLIDSVEKSETVLEDMKKKYYELRDHLKNLLLVSDGGNFSEDLEDNHEKIAEAYKNLEKVHERQRGASVIYMDVCKWVKKIEEKLKIETKDELSLDMLEIDKRVRELIEQAKFDKEEFYKKVELDKKKKTKEIIKEIYQEKPSPSRSPKIG